MRTRLAAPVLAATLLTTAALAPTPSALAAAPDSVGSPAAASIDPQNTGYILFTYSPLRRSAGAANKYEGPGDLRVIAPDGSGNFPLTTGPANDFDGVFSPDSQFVAFSSDRANRRAGITDLYIMDVEGNGLRRLTYGADTGGVSWSPDGQKIVVRDKKGLLIVSPEGGKARRLLRSAPNQINSKPVWTRDSSAVVFTRSVVAHGKTVSQSIWTVGADGSGEHRLFGGTGATTFSSDPAMSPDGFTLAWIVQNEHGSSLWLGDLYYGTLDNVRKFKVSKRMTYDGPAFAPDGSQLTIGRNYGNAKRGGELIVIDIGSGHEARVYTVTTGQVSAPNWAD